MLLLCFPADTVLEAEGLGSKFCRPHVVGIGSAQLVPVFRTDLPPERLSQMVHLQALPQVPVELLVTRQHMLGVNVLLHG